MHTLMTVALALIALVSFAPAFAAAQENPASELSKLVKSRVPKDVPVLEDLSVTRPDPSVPPELAGLSGAWAGQLRSERNNELMADFVYVFEKLSPDSLTIVSMGIGRLCLPVMATTG